jgi:hypothetical protein
MTSEDSTEPKANQGVSIFRSNKIYRVASICLLAGGFVLSCDEEMTVRDYGQGAYQFGLTALWIGIAMFAVPSLVSYWKRRQTAEQRQLRAARKEVMETLHEKDQLFMTDPTSPTFISSSIEEGGESQDAKLAALLLEIGLQRFDDRKDPTLRALSLFRELASPYETKHKLLGSGAVKSLGIDLSEPSSSEILYQPISRYRQVMDAEPDEWIGTSEALYYIGSQTSGRYEGAKGVWRFPWNDIKGMAFFDNHSPLSEYHIGVAWRQTEGHLDLHVTEWGNDVLRAMWEMVERK